MPKAFRIGRLFGVDLMLDKSWVLVFALVVWSLTSVFGTSHPTWTGGTVFVVAIVTALAFFGSVVVHELAHALVARAYGLPVNGITLHLFGGVSRLGREPASPGAEVLIAAVGPIASVMLGIGMLALAPLTVGSATTHTLLTWLGPVNVALGAFNLLPAFPMDGGRILRAALWKATGSLATATRWTTLVGQAAGVGLIAIGGLMALGVRVPFFGTGIVSALWLGFIGMFVRGAARQHQASAEVLLALEGVTVAQLMRPRAEGVPSNASVRALVEGELARRGEDVLPVFFGERFVGMVWLPDVTSIPQTEWDRHTAREIMRPAAAVPSVAPSDPAIDAFRAMGAAALPAASVVEDGELVGMLFAGDVARWVALHRRQSERRLLPA